MCGSDSGGYGDGPAAGNAVACANAVIAWGGLGGIIGSFFGPFGPSLGALGGGAAAAAFSDACKGGHDTY
jgi:hypothetical protein